MNISTSSCSRLSRNHQLPTRQPGRLTSGRGAGESKELPRLLELLRINQVLDVQLKAGAMVKAAHSSPGQAEEEGRQEDGSGTRNGSG